ncbi:unnamed protein product [Victoria cruziana]
MEREGREKVVEKKEETSSSFSFSSIALDGDLFNLVDDATPASRPLKFQPKFKPKLKGASSSTSVKQEPLPVKPEPDANPKPELAEPVDAVAGSTPMDVDTSTAMDNDEPESASPRGNRVVQEIDVFFNPSPIDVDAQLYIIQYPLRPCWRPYELDERCQEVRVKPKQSKVEMDMAIDVRSENYDSMVEDSLRIDKQTLSSSKAPPVTGYAVGYLIGNKLHLNPIHAVVQLRPSMAYLNASQDPMRKSGVEMKDGASGSAKTAEPSNRPATVRKDASGPIGTQSKRPMSYSQIKQEDDSEAWIPLEYLDTASPSAYRYQQKLVSEDVSSVHLSMHVDEYINSLVPGRPASLLTGKSKNDGSADILRRRIDKLPWEHWLERWYIAEHIQVARFADIMRVAYVSAEQDVLQELQENAHLVKGLWVPKSKFRYEGVLAALRDYVLLMFHKNGKVEHEKLKDSLKNINDPEGKIKTVLAPLALLRRATGTWVWHKPADKSFLDSYPEVVREQDRAWLASEHDIKTTFSTFTVSNSVKATVAPRKVMVANKQLTAKKLEQSVTQGESSKSSLGKGTLSDELREAFPKVLREVFNKYSVCSLQLIRQGLREMAISRATHPKHNSELVVAAARVASSVSNSELQSILSAVAVEINGVYVLESLNNQSDELSDEFRRFVIKLLKARGPNAKVKKMETVEAFKMHCNVEVPKPIYNKVMTELCFSVGTAWVMKSGDGKPP